MHKSKILLIDDDPAYLNETREVLRELGYDALTCNDPSNALNEIERFEPDCILLDLKMPKLDGKELLTLIRRRFFDIPVVVCSGIAALDVSFLLRSGACDVLRKPFTFEKLSETLEGAIHVYDDETPILVSGFDLNQIQKTVAARLIRKALVKTQFDAAAAAKMLNVPISQLEPYIDQWEFNE